MPDPQTPDSNSGPTLQSEAQRLANAARGRAADAVEELKVASNQVVDKVRELIEDANVKRVSIQREGKTLLEIPLTVGVGAGAAALLLNPAIAAVGALAALVSDVTLVIERTDASETEAAIAREAIANAHEPDPNTGDDDDESDSAGKTVGKPSAE